MILQIVGFKDSGKTTLLQQSITFLKSQGYHIVTIKHHGHEKDDITIQSSNVDHMKHFEAGADQSIVQGSAYQQTVTRRNQPSLEQLIKESVTVMPPADEKVTSDVHPYFAYETAPNTLERFTLGTVTGEGILKIEVLDGCVRFGQIVIRKSGK